MPQFLAPFLLSWLYFIVGAVGYIPLHKFVFHGIFISEDLSNSCSFLSPNPSATVSRDDIVFKDPLNTFAGIDNYKRIFWALRFTGQIFFKALWIDIVSIWQPVENVIMIRWIVHGIPRVLWDGHGRFDGTSEYKVGKNGKIYEHKVDNVAMNSPKKFKVLLVEELIRSLGCPSTPKPTYFETSLLHMISLMPFWLRWTWMRCYLSLYLMLANLAKG